MLSVDPGDPERRRAHVDAAASRAEVEGHADERDLSSWASRRRDASTRTSDGQRRSTGRAAGSIIASRARMSTPPTRKPAPAAPAPRRRPSTFSRSSPPAACSPPSRWSACAASQKVNGLTAEQAHHPARASRTRRRSRRPSPRTPACPTSRSTRSTSTSTWSPRRIAGPFARKHGMVAISKTDDKITVAVHDPFAPFPVDDIKRVTGLDVERVVATRSRRRGDQQGLLRPEVEPADRGEAAHAQSRISTVDLGNQEFLSRASERARPRGRARWSRPSTTS